MKINKYCIAIKLMAALAFMVALGAAIVGCTSVKSGSAGKQLASIIALAYENGGREAVTNRIDELVLEGKLKPEQGARLQKLADLACEKLIEDLANGEIDVEYSEDGEDCGDDCKDCVPEEGSGTDGA